MAVKSTETSTPATPPDQKLTNGDSKNDANANDNIEPDQDFTPVVPDSGEASEGGKLKMIVQLLKRCLGVKDLAAMYVSFLHCRALAQETDRLGLPLHCCAAIWDRFARPFFMVGRGGL